MKTRLISVTVERLNDEDPDSSHLGEYKAGPTDGFCFDRQAGALLWEGQTVGRMACGCGRNELRYVGGFQHRGGEGWAHMTEAEIDQAWQAAWPEIVKYEFPMGDKRIVLNALYCLQDVRRLEGLNNGDWHFIGIRAQAEVVTDSGTIQRIYSGGLWGIESDSGAYLAEVEAEQLAELMAELESLGLPTEVSEAVEA